MGCVPPLSQSMPYLRPATRDEANAQLSVPSVPREPCREGKSSQLNKKKKKTGVQFVRACGLTSAFALFLSLPSLSLPAFPCFFEPHTQRSSSFLPVVAFPTPLKPTETQIIGRIPGISASSKFTETQVVFEVFGASHEGEGYIPPVLIPALFAYHILSRKQTRANGTWISSTASFSVHPFDSSGFPQRNDASVIYC